MLRSPLLKTTTWTGSWRLAVSSELGSSTDPSAAKGRILPRYCTTRWPPACSIFDCGISSRRATRESGTESRSNEPARNRRNAWRSLPALGVFGLRPRLLARFLHYAGQLRDSQHVENQGHLAVAHDGC